MKKSDSAICQILIAVALIFSMLISIAAYLSSPFVPYAYGHDTDIDMPAIEEAQPTQEAISADNAL